MTKKLVLVLALGVQFAAAMSVSGANAAPSCLPCDASPAVVMAAPSCLPCDGDASPPVVMAAPSCLPCDSSL
jgi:hypothetical protein